MTRLISDYPSNALKNGPKGPAFLRVCVWMEKYVTEKGMNLGDGALMIAVG
jgi:hypothetical protein